MLFDFAFLHAEDRTVQVHVFPPCQLLMEAGANFQQRSDTPPYLDLAGCRVGDPGEYLQQRAFSRPFSPNDADYFPLVSVKGDVPERPDGLVFLASELERIFRELDELLPQRDVLL